MTYIFPSKTLAEIKKLRHILFKTVVPAPFGISLPCVGVSDENDDGGYSLAAEAEELELVKMEAQQVPLAEYHFFLLYTRI